MAEIKIDAVSKFGFMIDKKWNSFDKSFHPEGFHKDDLVDIRLNDKGYIISATLIKAAEKKPFIPYKKPFKDNSREILKGQALNGALSNTQEINLSSVEGRKIVINNAHALFVELEQAGFYNW